MGGQVPRLTSYGSQAGGRLGLPDERPPDFLSENLTRGWGAQAPSLNPKPVLWRHRFSETFLYRKFEVHMKQTRQLHHSRGLLLVPTCLGDNHRPQWCMQRIPTSSKAESIRKWKGVISGKLTWSRSYIARSYPTPRNALSVGPFVRPSVFLPPSNAHAHQSNVWACALDFRGNFGF